MKTRPETLERDKKIASLYDSGYTLKEIYAMKFKNMSGKVLGEKYIQNCIKEHSNVDYNGRITDSKIFSMRDIENILSNPQEKDGIIKKRVIDHYKKSHEKNLVIDTKNKAQEQAKLRAIVFKRDNYQCVKCGSNLGIECDHKNNNDYKDFDEEVEFCETLCYKCHRENYY